MIDFNLKIQLALWRLNVILDATRLANIYSLFINEVLGRMIISKYMHIFKEIREAIWIVDRYNEDDLVTRGIIIVERYLVNKRVL